MMRSSFTQLLELHLTVNVKEETSSWMDKCIPLRQLWTAHIKYVFFWTSAIGGHWFFIKKTTSVTLSVYWRFLIMNLALFFLCVSELVNYFNFKLGQTTYPSVDLILMKRCEMCGFLIAVSMVLLASSRDNLCICALYLTIEIRNLWTR